MSFDVEILVIKVCSKFSSSTKNVNELKNCFDFLEQTNYETLKHVSTRWASLYTAVARFLKNWQAIKVYFINQGMEECTIWIFVGEKEDGISETKKHCQKLCCIL